MSYRISELFKTLVAATYCNKSGYNMKKLSYSGVTPEYIKICRWVPYDQKNLDAQLDSKTRRRISNLGNVDDQ